MIQRGIDPVEVHMGRRRDQSVADWRAKRLVVFTLHHGLFTHLHIGSDFTLCAAACDQSTDQRPQALGKMAPGKPKNQRSPQHPHADPGQPRAVKPQPLAAEGPQDITDDTA